MIKPILIAPNPNLKTPTQAVSEINNEIKQLITDLTDTMRQSNGVGLSANQIGSNQSVIVVEYKKPTDSEDDNPDFPLTVLINPTITEHSVTTKCDEEGCLSVPNTFGSVDRWQTITVQYLDEKGQPQTLLARDLYARAIQHEMDHLVGKLFIEKATNIHYDELDEDVEEF